MTNDLNKGADPHSLAGPYALDALPLAERAAFEQHLDECDTCPADVEDFRLTAARLGAGASDGVVLPSGLRSRVLAEVAETRQLPPMPRHIGSARSRREGDAAASGTRTPLWRQPRILAAAAALVLVTGGAGVGIGIATSQSQQTRLADQARDEITSILSAPDSTTRHATVTGGGRVTLVSSPSHDAAVAVFNELPANADDRSYQLWMLHGTAARSAGVVHVPASGGGAEPGKVTRVLRGGIVGADGFGLTVEPAGGSQTPTLPTIAQIPFA
ncbi:anti-sigma factor [Tenggerimyces flavus]|uniref:Regulator of SigK n=1 Tax=Tenggerimyces flavus TaxID=1708749 RepID=A0ABV7YD01_9ACTN|nr:anti-sigma factor [Tenggerimyces flavus]MBM7789729.1 anti-sigma-K factor RskA [Tenggerimyces flavus]